MKGKEKHMYSWTIIRPLSWPETEFYVISNRYTCFSLSTNMSRTLWHGHVDFDKIPCLQLHLMSTCPGIYLLTSNIFRLTCDNYRIKTIFSLEVGLNQVPRVTSEPFVCLFCYSVCEVHDWTNMKFICLFRDLNPHLLHESDTPYLLTLSHSFHFQGFFKMPPPAWICRVTWVLTRHKCPEIVCSCLPHTNIISGPFWWKERTFWLSVDTEKTRGNQNGIKWKRDTKFRWWILWIRQWYELCSQLIPTVCVQCFIASK